MLHGQPVLPYARHCVYWWAFHSIYSVIYSVFEAFLFVLMWVVLVLLYALFCHLCQTLYCPLWYLTWISWIVVFYPLCHGSTHSLVTSLVSFMTFGSFIILPLLLGHLWCWWIGVSASSFSLYLHSVLFTLSWCNLSTIVSLQCHTSLHYCSDRIISLCCSLNFSPVVSDSYLLFCMYLAVSLLSFV